MLVRQGGRKRGKERVRERREKERRERERSMKDEGWDLARATSGVHYYSGETCWGSCLGEHVRIQDGVSGLVDRHLVL